MLLLTEVVLRQVGICGRTGAGKSSFVSAFFRLTDVQTGAIRIDGYDIGTMSLRGVRSSLAIIPQVRIRDTPYVCLGMRVTHVGCVPAFSSTTGGNAVFWHPPPQPGSVEQLQRRPVGGGS